MKPIADILACAVSRLLKPLARILLRHNVSFLTFSELAKRVFVEVAENEFHPEGRKQSLSRVAMVTGLSRKEVLRIKRTAMPVDGGMLNRQNRSVRVVNGWTHDRSFMDDSGNPRLLEFDNDETGFSALAARYSGDIPPRAVLDELVRIGLAEVDASGLVRLVSRMYIPREEVGDKLAIMGVEAKDLLETIDHNVHAVDKEPNFQRKVCYFRFPVRHVPHLRELAASRSQELLEEINTWMAEHDDAADGESGEGVCRTGLSIFFFEGPVEEDHENTES